MNPITSFENLPGELILAQAKALIKSMASYGLGATHQIDKLKKVNEPLFDRFCTQAKETFSQLNARYPGIVIAILNNGNDFDLNRLARMIGLSEKLNNGEIPELETHVQMSTELRNQYVLPKLGLTPSEVTEVDINDYDEEKLKKLNIETSHIKFD